MELNLTDKTVVVTGASRGIGLAIVEAFAKEGARVVAGARSTANLDALAQQYDVLPVAADLTTVEGANKLIEAAGGYGKIDVLVNNLGGLWPRLAGVAAVTDEQWLESLTLNFFSTVRVTRAALPQLLETRGAIVNIGSVNSILADPSIVDYAASKAALSSYAKSLSKELGPQGVRINTVAPGPVDTDLWHGADGLTATIGAAAGISRDDARDAVVANLGGIPTGRFSSPAEVADLALFLASERASNITGADLTIDGGLIKTI